MTETTTILRGDIPKPRKVPVRRDCTRCGGAGGWKGWPGFTCFRCSGFGSDPVDGKDWKFPTGWTDAEVEEFLAKKEAQREARAEKRKANQVAKAQANKDAFAAVHPELWAAMEAAEGGFLSSLAMQVTYHGVLSDKQIDAAERAVEHDAEWVAKQAVWDAEKAAAADAPTGKVEVEGEVVSMKWTEGRFPAHKMMVKADTGYRVWVTVPASLDGRSSDDGRDWIVGVVKGDRVRFTATLEHSDDDATFAFGKRPTGAELVSTEPQGTR